MLNDATSNRHQHVGLAEPAAVLEPRRRLRHRHRLRHLLRRPHRVHRRRRRRLGTELIVNGGFEGLGLAVDAERRARTGRTARTRTPGTGYSILGACNNASGSEYQTVSIPSGATASLTFWLNITTSEACCTRVRLHVRGGAEHVGRGALDARHVDERELRSRGRRTRRSRSAWLAWRGQTVRVQFRATTDVSLPTSFRIDDVSLR